MDINKLYSARGIDSIITELEVTLQISGDDYEEDSYEAVLNNVKKRINQQHQLDLLKNKVCDVELETSVFRTAVSMFLDGMTLMHAKLCAIGQLMRYNTLTEVSLDAINYISYTEDSMKVILETLQREKTIPTTDEAMKAIKGKIMRIKTTREKRLFLIMLICYDIGLNELVAAIAEILQLGGLYNK